MKTSLVMAAVTGYVCVASHIWTPELVKQLKGEAVFVAYETFPPGIWPGIYSPQRPLSNAPDFMSKFSHYGPTSSTSPYKADTRTPYSPPSTSTQGFLRSSPTSKSEHKPTSYPEIALMAHNLHRRNHSAAHLEWDADLARTASLIASSCVFEHNVAVDGGGYGQNIAAGIAADNISAVITDLFYNDEINNFDGLYGETQPPMTAFDDWGHFTQVIWKRTSTVGCATKDCTGNGLAGVDSEVSPHFTVCNYKSPGNVEGRYAVNVGIPLGLPSAEWDTGLY